jgi:hypothetical protein
MAQEAVMFITLKLFETENQIEVQSREGYHLLTRRRENLKSYILILYSYLRVGSPSSLFP